MPNTTFDVVIIGSGPGGYEAAVHAAQLGKTVACVEKAELGGICLNWGCIPTKALLHDAHLYHQILHEAPAFGITADPSQLQWNKVIARSRAVANTLSGQIGFLFKKNGVESFKGTAFVSQAGGGGAIGCTIDIKDPDGKTTPIQAANVLICTGARNRELPGVTIDGQTILSSREAMILQDIPKKLVIIGAGAIGVEFAYIYSSFGTQVTLVEMLDRILPIEDEDISHRLETIFRKRGMDIRTQHKTEKIEVTPTGVRATLSDGAKQVTLEADKALVAIGVIGNTDNLFAPACQPEIVKGHFKVGKDFQTNIKGVYAAGDVIGPPWLAHVATMEAKIAIERMFNASGGGDREMDYSLVPGCTYCVPQVASVGLTEKQCQDQNLDYEVGKWLFAANGKALASNAPDGFVKLIFAKKYGELLGAHLLGDQVTDLLAELVLAKRLEATKTEIVTTIHAHPTLSEAVMEAAAQAGGHGK